MGVSEPLISSAGVLAAVVAILVDGRNAVNVAVVAVAAGLSPTLAAASGAPATLVLLGAAGAALVLSWVSRRAARHLPWVAGLDPLIPAFAPPLRLFGPRSVRVWGAALAVPVASWVSFNVSIGAVAAVQGLLFPVAYVWACGGLRLLVARTVEDIAVGVGMVGLSSATAWLIRGGPDAYVGAAALAVLAPTSAAVAGWLGGRHARRPVEGTG
ncbi:MAG TPA: hypothetical protein VNY76_01870 [Candidatus Acidoferrales bacterium]|jgi:hypothetical protein|nr:hypothetical protein [Candidatus Acidoferrales bacterium]